MFYPLTAIRDNSRAVKRGPPLLSTTIVVFAPVSYWLLFTIWALHLSPRPFIRVILIGRQSIIDFWLFFMENSRNNPRETKGQICKFRKWNESKMVDVNWSEDDAVLGLFADNNYEEADFMGFLPQDMNAVLSKVPLSDFVLEHNTIYRPIYRYRGKVDPSWKFTPAEVKKLDNHNFRLSLCKSLLAKAPNVI